MPDVVRASIVLARTSGLPEDRVNMSFWFQPTSGAGVLNTLAAAVRDWLIVDNSATFTGALSTTLADSIATTGHSVNLYEYDMASGLRTTYENAPPDYSLTFSATVGTTSLPGEVALCASYRNNTGAVVGGGNFNAPAARRRGRVFFGPIDSTQAAMTTPVAGDARPSAGLLAALVENTNNLRVGSGVSGAGYTFVIYSRPYEGRNEIARPGRPSLPAIPARAGQAFVVEQVWVDDAFDTQRRRGTARTTRTILG